MSSRTQTAVTVAFFLVLLLTLRVCASRTQAVPSLPTERVKYEGTYSVYWDGAASNIPRWTVVVSPSKRGYTTVWKFVYGDSDNYRGVMQVCDDGSVIEWWQSVSNPKATGSIKWTWTDNNNAIGDKGELLKR